MAPMLAKFMRSTFCRARGLIGIGQVGVTCSCVQIPPLYITTVTKDDPADSYVRIEFPYFAKNSPEEEMWRALLDGLEERIRAAAKEKAKTRDSTDAPDGPK